MSRSRQWTFTLNNYVETELVSLYQNLSKEETRYAIVGKEKGEEGTPHLQGFVSFKNPKRFNGVKALVGDRAHVEISRSNEETNRNYCSKGEQSKAEWNDKGTRGPNYGLNSDVKEFGERSHCGKRNDLEAFKLTVKDGETNLKTLREEHSQVMAKYPRFASEYIRDQIEDPPVPSHPLRPWQQDLNQRLIHEPNDRDVVFVVDKKGKQGKSWFAKYYRSLHDNAFLMRPGKHADMCHMLPNSLRVLFIDCTRTQVEYLPYTFIEEVKDGEVQSGKYEGSTKRFKPPHVVVMMNIMPDFEKLSEDRYVVIELRD